MTTSDSIKVLVVDDLADKRLVYHSILEEPGQEIILASSGADALRQVLQNEFAVILIDVNMPVMDGFETASLIRSRRRCAHTPIIFVTAHADELHALRGYATGAVDYVLTPVVPEILRTKVRVFVELFRKTQQIQRQAEALRDLQAREHQRQLRETNERLDLALDAGRMGVFEWDLGSELLNWTSMLETIFGFAPGEFTGEAGQLRERLHPQDRELVLRELVHAARSGSSFLLEHRIVRAGGEEAWVELRGMVYQPEGAEEARVGAGRAQPAAAARIVGVCMDITERKRAEADRAHLAAIVESSDDAIVGKSLDGIITSWNAGAQRLYGYAPHEIIGKPVTMLLPPERMPEEDRIVDRLRKGEAVPSFDTQRVTKDGRTIDVALTVSPIKDRSGRVVGASKVARDITARKRAEAELARYRAHLEELVRERTAELEASHERLRLSDRLASIGTLAAGLGHDMGNLLLPMRMRLSMLSRMNLPAEAQEDITAICEACEYLKRLSRGLRLFALSPEDSAASGERTELSSWWSEVAPFLRNALPRTIQFEGSVPEGMPEVAISPHMLTQSVYNLVQNAGDVMRECESGRVRVSAETSPDGRHAVLQVADNGPGMSEEVLSRCMEPFYTTKTRGISTGLGLALVRGAVYNAGGSIEVASRPGEGTTFRLYLPIARESAADVRSAEDGRMACVCLKDARLAAYVTSVLRSLKVRVAPPAWPPSAPVSLVVVDSVPERSEDLRAFIEEDPSRAVVAIGEVGEVSSGRVLALGAKPSAVQIRSSLARLVSPQGAGAASEPEKALS